MLSATSPTTSSPLSSCRPLSSRGSGEGGSGAETRRSRNRLADYRPYTKQREFHAAGADTTSACSWPATSSARPWAGGFEWAIHLTGRYPDWWEGRVFDEPVRFWASGVTGESTRDNPQRDPGRPAAAERAWGTGAIPHDA
jgi:hypothetical protein